MKSFDIGRGLAVLLTSTVLLSGCSKTEENKLEMELEKSTHKEISLIEFSDIKHSSYLMLNYCKYKTLDEIISVYLNLKKLNLHSKDYMNEVEK